MVSEYNPFLDEDDDDEFSPSYSSSNGDAVGGVKVGDGNSSSGGFPGAADGVVNYSDDLLDDLLSEDGDEDEYIREIDELKNIIDSSVFQAPLKPGDAIVSPSSESAVIVNMDKTDDVVEDGGSPVGVDGDDEYIDDSGDDISSLLSDDGDDDGGVEGEYSSGAAIVSGIFDDDEEEEEEDIFNGFNINDVLSDAIDFDASDVYVNADERVAFKHLGKVVYRDDYIIPDSTIMLRVQQAIVNNVLDQTFVEEMELDTSYVITSGRHKGRRFRLSVGKSFNNVYLCFRVITNNIPTPEQLGITGELASWVDLPKGLIMVNGATGSGKSTTIASLIRRIQLDRENVILTMEKPIEYVYEKNSSDNKALVIQRDVGIDSHTFGQALTTAMRQAPDIIIVGEVRNTEEVNELLRAAETGHLAISTMHTDSAAQTIDRIKSLFSGDDQRRVLSSLSSIARGFCNQCLVLSIDGNSRSAVREILTVNEVVQDLILTGNVKGIKEYQYNNKITMEHELCKAIRENKCTVKEARSKSSDPLLFDRVYNEMMR